MPSWVWLEVSAVSLGWPWALNCAPYKSENVFWKRIVWLREENIKPSSSLSSPETNYYSEKPWADSASFKTNVIKDVYM